MRTTIDLPDHLFRRTKALAAVRGSSLEELIVRAVEHEVNSGLVDNPPARRSKIPVIHLQKGRKIDLSHFDFDGLLA